MLPVVSRRPASSNQRGFSLMEMIVVVAIASVVLLVAYQILEDSYKTALSLEARNEMTLMAQRPANAIQTAIYQAETIFGNDAAGVGTSYYNRMSTQLTGANAIATGTSLPVIAPTAVMTADGPTENFVGNCLLIARQLPPLFVNYDHDNNNSTAQIPFPVDRYRFELFYLRRDNGRAFSPTSSYTLSLHRARTIDFADAFQIRPLMSSGAGNAFTLSQRQQITAGMNAAGLTKAWDTSPGLLANQAFYNITMSGTNAGVLTLNTTQPLTLASGTGVTNLTAEIYSADITGAVNYSIAYPQPTAVAAKFRGAAWMEEQSDGSFTQMSGLRVAAYGGTNGFEVKVGGAGAGQRVLVRVVMMANFAAGIYDSEEAVVITSRGLSI